MLYFENYENQLITMNAVSSSLHANIILFHPFQELHTFIKFAFQKIVLFIEHLFFPKITLTFYVIKMYIQSCFDHLLYMKNPSSFFGYFHINFYFLTFILSACCLLFVIGMFFEILDYLVNDKNRRNYNLLSIQKQMKDLSIKIEKLYIEMQELTTKTNEKNSDIKEEFYKLQSDMKTSLNAQEEIKMLRREIYLYE